MASTPSPLRYCGRCHAPASLDCIRSLPLLVCGEGSTTHDAQATLIVEYIVDLSGRGDYDNGDTTRRALFCCDHPACVGSAENHAHDAGLHIETRPLSLADIEDATGLDLSAVSA